MPKPLAKKKNIIFLVALMLLCAILVHSISFNHQHPVFFGHGVQAALHGDDKKRLLLAVLVSFLALVLAGSGFRVYAARPASHLPTFVRRKYIWRNFLDPVRIALRKGIVHPKLCG